MANLKSGKKGENIWTRITLDELVDAIGTLGDLVNELDKETWRFNVRTRSSSSLWGRVIGILGLDHNEKTRHSLYNVWHSERYDLSGLVKNKIRANDANVNDEENGALMESEDLSVIEQNNIGLVADLSLPLPQKPNTRANQMKNTNANTIKNILIEETSFVFTVNEWKNVFSNTTQGMKDDWTDVFYDKLVALGNRCPVRFKTPYIKEGKRKKVCKFLCCHAMCTIGECPRVYQMILKNEPDENSSVIFLVRIFNEERHDPKIGISARKLTGANRLRVGERANRIGPLAVFRERVEAADENLLAAGNYTGCETYEGIKKTTCDYRKTMRIDENIFVECRMVSRAYSKEDTTSTHVKGYVHDKGEMPFRTHLFCQPQIQRYIDYCMKEKYSYVHIDATGGVLKQMREQNQSLLYAIIFKDGTDSIDTIPLGHAILTDHTVPSILFFLGKVAYNIAQIKGRLILPSFFVIDFSAAIMNAILLAFNLENINTHLNRCWNAVCRKYNVVQLRSLSFIHFCCCHVMHAIARSLTAAHIDKKIRRGVLHIFAIILCGNDLEHLYGILGRVINIFGEPNEPNAIEKFEEMISFQLDVDKESQAMLMDREEIFQYAKKHNDELKAVDEYFRSNTPIIHQSPFNQEATRRHPNLSTLINNKSKYVKTTNPLFSPTIVRIFYRWWAYLPLWTGLLWNFQERYSNNIEMNISVTYHPIRHSNALIESYFRTFKRSLRKNKASNRPSEIIMELYRSIKIQMKAITFNVTQSSKGRKRKQTTENHMTQEEKWGKRGKCRSVYFNKIDKIASKRTRSKPNNAQSNDIIENISESEDISTVSPMNLSISSTDELSDKIHASASPRYTNNQSPSLTSQSDSVVSIERSDNVQVCLDESSDDEKRSEASVQLNFNENVISSLEHTLYSVGNSIYQSKRLEKIFVIEPIPTIDHLRNNSPARALSQTEASIDGYTLPWPKFGINEAIFETRSYTLTNTCGLDSALFSLYYLYKSDINIGGEFDMVPDGTIYSILLKTFSLIEKEGWDNARLYWLLTNGILKTSDRKKDLFGFCDEQVFRFLDYTQSYSYEVKCTRPECKEKERVVTTTIFKNSTSVDHIEKFDNETVDVCDAVMGKYNQITEGEARKRKYRLGESMPHNSNINRTDTDRYIFNWRCNAVREVSVASFDYGHPPVLMVDMQSSSERERDLEGYEAYVVRLRDISRVLRISSIEYQLRVVIHLSDGHFTATFIGKNGTMYAYDDLKGIKQVRSSIDPVVFAIYAQVFEF